MSGPIHAVTGAFGFSGRSIARRLLDRGHRVRTLTSSRRANPVDDVEVRPLDFDAPDELTRSLESVRVLYNTYWVRFNFRKSFSRATAVANTRMLFECAKAAGVERIVHVSITNPSPRSPFEYFRNKAELEAALKGSGLSHAILRPAVLFGPGDVLVNNIAWILRRFPVFGVFGDGSYRIRPIDVDDLARLAVDQGEQKDDVIIDAVGPETFTYRELVETIARIIGKRRMIIRIPAAVGWGLGRLIGWLVGDVVLTRDEIDALMADLLHVDGPATGATRLTEWARAHAGSLGVRYASELARRR